MFLEFAVHTQFGYSIGSCLYLESNQFVTQGSESSGNCAFAFVVSNCLGGKINRLGKVGPSTHRRVEYDDTIVGYTQWVAQASLYYLVYEAYHETHKFLGCVICSSLFP